MRLSVAVANLLLFFTAVAFAQQRSDLHLFQYGLTSTDQRAALFEDFRYVLEEKMPRLSDELSLSEALPVLKAIRVVPVKDEHDKLRRPSELIGNLQLRQRYWDDVGALALLTGVVDMQGAVPSIHTTLYWGKLKPPLAQEMIDIELPLTGNYFDTTFDSHSVAILYAIANQPDVQCNQFTAIVALLSEALKRAKAIAVQQAALGGELEQKIQQSILALKSECHR
ncbi:hypothetical protein [Rheinheimera maricola]|uniref:Uncharacterized protein n=1 Tax=Rheinheimera maricola TaxID=2793282 RepID=A0ABS7X4S3_9GAMM|nr:hypothetical protein [Rheinheimera maricola]MBZ9610539.1 hypothetical protein [Rheinheimera maricola]